jgi:predicted RNA binding protein YcfA (HicA-like mRNA interferase family)
VIKYRYPARCGDSMSSLPAVSDLRLIKALRKLGFEVIRIQGSHHFVQHPDGRCTVVPDIVVKRLVVACSHRFCVTVNLHGKSCKKNCVNLLTSCHGAERLLLAAKRMRRSLCSAARLRLTIAMLPTIRIAPMTSRPSTTSSRKSAPSNNPTTGIT